MTYDGKAVFFDMDGVLYRGTTGLPYAGESVSWARSKGIRPAFITNNSTRTPQTFKERLAGFGIDAALDEIMTSAIATAEYIRTHYGAGGKAFCIGLEGISEAIAAVGITAVSLDDCSKCDYVIVGMSPDFDYKQLVRAQQEILINGAKLIGTNPDRTYPWNDGTVRPGGGTLLIAVVACTDAKPIMIGKPELYMVELLAKRFNVSPTDCLMVGDKLGTDILMGNRFGMHTLLVLTGISTREEADSAVGEFEAEFILDDLSGFPEVVQKLWGSS